MIRYTIKQARNMSNKTQIEIADLLGVCESTYIKYEKYSTLMNMEQGYHFSEIVNLPISNIIFFDQELQKNCTPEKAS